MNPSSLPAYKNDDSRETVRTSYGPKVLSFAAGTSPLLMDGSENACYSPLSLYLALALVSTGTEGETLDELMAALQIEGAGEEKLLSEVSQIMTSLPFTTGVESGQEEETDSVTYSADPYKDNTFRSLSIANSLWVDNTYQFLDSFEATAADPFEAGANQVDGFGSETADAMSRWVDEQTHGLISPHYEFASGTLLALINTVYLCDSWNSPFREESNTEEAFVITGGETVRCTYMNDHLPQSQYIAGEGYKGISLYLRGSDTVGGRMTFILPDENVALSSFFSDAEKLRSIMEAEADEYADITLQLPKFKFSATLGSEALQSALEALGVKKVFDPYSAQLSRMVTNKEDDALSLSIDQVQQDCQVGIDENGVEAAAATMISFAGAAPLEMEKVDLIFNRPFLFVISYGDLPLFLGAVADPTAG